MEGKELSSYEELLVAYKKRIGAEDIDTHQVLAADGKASGYITGLQLANKYGFTTQNPACYEICSNEATTKQRRQIIDGNEIVVYKPISEVTEQNRAVLQFLDLMSIIDKYSEISGKELTSKLKKYVDLNSVDFSIVKEYLPLYPDKVYRNIYEGGLMGELV